MSEPQWVLVDYNQGITTVDALLFPYLSQPLWPAYLPRVLAPSSIFKASCVAPSGPSL